MRPTDGQTAPCPCRVRYRLCESPSSRRTEPRGGPAHPAEHCDDVARPCSAVSQRVERGEAGAHQGDCLDRRKFVRHQRDRAGRDNQVLAIAAVIGDTGDLTGHAGEEFSPAAVVATSTISTVPPNAHALARMPVDDAAPNRIDHSGHLMPGYPRVLNTGVSSLLGERIAVADAACLNPDPDRSGGPFPVSDVQRSRRARLGGRPAPRASSP
jgi:hypothetical protein